VAVAPCNVTPEIQLNASIPRTKRTLPNRGRSIKHYLLRQLWQQRLLGLVNCNRPATTHTKMTQFWEVSMFMLRSRRRGESLKLR